MRSRRRYQLRPICGCAWVLNWKNGWVRFGDHLLIRWNVDKFMQPHGHVYFAILNPRKGA